jgi:uncharacterized protein (DUF1499 family)
MKDMNMRFKFCILPILLTNFLFGCSNTRQGDRLGLQNGHLRPCPNTPNCVSSTADDNEHQVPALVLQVAPEQGWEQVKSTITALPRTRMITATSEYLHVECRSAVFGFIDDLELHLLPEQRQIEIRSLARLGYYDFGVNRKRVKQIRVTLQADRVVQ